MRAKRLVSSMLTVVLTTTLSTSLAFEEHTVMFNAAPEDVSTPIQNGFDCVGHIATVVQFDANNEQIRNQTINVEWFGPTGKLMMANHAAEFLQSGEQAFRWSSIHIKRPRGGGLFALMDPSAGMTDLIGEWNTKIYVDKELVGKTKFNVDC